MKVRKISITTQILIVISVLLLAANVILGIIVMNRVKGALLKSIQDKMISIADSASAAVDGAALERYRENNDDEDAFNTVMDTLVLFRDNAEIEYIYTIYAPGGDKFEFIIDSDPEEPANCGDEIEYTEGLAAAARGTAAYDDEPYEDEWGRHYSAYSPIYNGKSIVGIIGIDISFDWYEQQVSSLRRIILGICAGAFIISFLIVFFICSRIKKSFAVLDEKLGDIANGSGDLTREINLDSGDEFEVVADKVNKFIREVQGLASGVSGVSKDVLKIGDELKETAERNTDSIHSINNEIESISVNMEECGASANTTSRTLADATRDIEALTEEIAQVHEIVNNANKSAQTASKHALDERAIAIKTLNEIEERVNIASKDASKIEQVREIAEQITEIASQTQILSLNAQIEAARAGDQGAGFAVVATEVGHLSTEITEAVSRINDINKQVIDAVTKLIDSSKEMSEFMGRTVTADYDSYADIGREYGDTTLSIDEALNSLQNRSDDISRNVKQVDATIGEISNSVNECADKASDLAGAAASIAGSMDGLQNASLKNSEQARLLGEKISKYKF